MKYIINIVIALYFILGLKFFTYTKLDPTLFGYILKSAVILLVGFIVFFWTAIKKYQDCYVSFNYLLFFCLWPLITAVSCYFGNGQSISSSLGSCIAHSILTIYFICILFDVDRKFIVNLIITLAIVRTGLTILQQFSYPDVWFSMRTGLWNEETGQANEEIRSGIYRFLIADAYYLPLFMGFYSFEKILKGEYRKYAIFFIIACVGLYLDQSRQVIASFIASLFIVPFISNGSKYKYVVIVSAIILAVFANFSALFGDLQEQTANEMNESYIRLISYSYYWENMGGIVTALFGNGFPGSSSYGTQILELQQSGLWRVDIGIVGAMHLMGVLFVAVFLYYYWDVIKRYWNSLEMPLQFMFISILLQIPLILPLYNTSLPGYECFMALLFYLTDVSILENHENYYLEEGCEEAFDDEEEYEDQASSEIVYG